MGRKQDDYPNGFVLVKNNRYISSVITNGNPENPVLYYTPELNEALAFQREEAAIKRAKKLGATLVSFRTEDQGRGHRPKRVITGRMEV